MLGKRHRLLNKWPCKEVKQLPRRRRARVARRRKRTSQTSSHSALTFQHLQKILHLQVGAKPKLTLK